MGQIPLHRTSFFEHRTNLNELSSSIDDRTRTSEFWLQMNRHRTLNLKGLH